ncbi:unnamed protein product [Penicillium pancosmium]
MELPTLLILAGLFLGKYHCEHSHITRHLAVPHSSSKQHCDCRPLLHAHNPSVQGPQLTVSPPVFRFVQSRRAAATPMESHGKVANIDNDVIFKALVHSGAAVVDFYATWCGPCRAVAPKVGELSEKYQNVRFVQVDVDKLRGVASEFNVTAMPTFVLMKDGKEVQRIRGADIRALEAGIQAISA